MLLRTPLLLALMALFTGSGLLAGCASRAPEPEWLDGIPPAAYFRAEWRESGVNQSLQSEEEYLLWVTRFYAGYGAVPGWLSMTEQVIERLPSAEHDAIEARLFELGRRIGAEWAKDNSVRRLNTRSAGVWRDALLEAFARRELNAYLDRLAADVDALLSGDLNNDAIHFERYYFDEFDE
jgi:hypothetical protein